MQTQDRSGSLPSLKVVRSLSLVMHQLIYNIVYFSNLVNIKYTHTYPLCVDITTCYTLLSPEYNYHLFSLT